MCLAVAGMFLAGWMGSAVFKMERSPVSLFLLTVLLGLLIRNVAGLPTAFENGLRVCVRVILRMGVALLGLQLSLAAARTAAALGQPYWREHSADSIAGTRHRIFLTSRIVYCILFRISHNCYGCGAH